MNEMTPNLYRWRLAKCTSVKRFTFWKVSAKICNFRVPIYKGVPLPWMKWNQSLNDDCWPTILVWKDSLSEKLVLKYATLGFPFIKGFPSHERNDTHPLMMTASQVYAREKFHFQKSYWNPSFNYDWLPTTLLWTFSFSEKWVLIYTT